MPKFNSETREECGCCRRDLKPKPSRVDLRNAQRAAEANDPDEATSDKCRLGTCEECNG